MVISRWTYTKQSQTQIKLEKTNYYMFCYTQVDFKFPIIILPFPTYKIIRSYFLLNQIHLPFDLSLICR